MPDLLFFSGLFFSALSSFFGCCFLFLKRKQQKRRDLCLASSGSAGLLESRSVTLEGDGLSGWVISRMAKKSLPSYSVYVASSSVWVVGTKKIESLLLKSGLSGLVSCEGVVSERRNLSVAFSLVGLLTGFVFSELLALLLFVVGFTFGWSAPVRALKRERDARTQAVESDLARMLEVVVLGLHGGLSFDRSLSYFCEFFDCGLSRSCSAAQTQWSYGLLTREEALKELSGSYDSKLLERAVSSINRSLRYGTSLADDLSAAASSARAQRRTLLEEKIAKAPVKMLLPVGALMLPAMLILVVGPILLELMGNL